MVMAQQEMHLPAQHDLLAAVHAVRDQVESAESLEVQPGAYPAREERKGERVRRRDRQSAAALLAYRSGIAPRSFHAPHDVGRLRQKMRARLGQRDALRAAHEKPGADPILERANAPAA